MTEKKHSDDLFAMYETSVQDPPDHVLFFERIYREIFGRDAHSLREDFCGTFLIALEWIKRHPKNTAIGLDLDRQVLDYGKRQHLSRLARDQQKRMKILRQNVISVTSPKSDMIVGCNFSFYIFKERDLLLKYFKACHKSLSRQGLLVLEMAGGPGMIEKIKERTPQKKGNKPWFTYVWDQKSFDPITHDALYSIHFKMPDGRTHEDAFIYDWRLWTLPEVRDLMKDAGYSKVHVFWEQSDEDGEGTGEYLRQEKGTNDWTWIAYIVGVR